jgi:hypothetical protein
MGSGPTAELLGRKHHISIHTPVGSLTEPKALERPESRIAL